MYINQKANNLSIHNVSYLYNLFLHPILGNRWFFLQVYCLESLGLGGGIGRGRSSNLMPLPGLSGSGRCTSKDSLIVSLLP